MAPRERGEILERYKTESLRVKKQKERQGFKRDKKSQSAPRERERKRFKSYKDRESEEAQIKDR